MLAGKSSSGQMFLLRSPRLCSFFFFSSAATGSRNQSVSQRSKVTCVCNIGDLEESELGQRDLLQADGM